MQILIMITQEQINSFVNDCCGGNEFKPNNFMTILVIYGDANVDEKIKKIDGIDNKLIVNYSYGKEDVDKRMFDFSICKYLRNREYLMSKTYVFVENVDDDLVKEHGLYACFGTQHEYRHLFHMDRGCIDDTIYVQHLVFLVKSPDGFIDKTEIKRRCYFMEVN